EPTLEHRPQQFADHLLEGATAARLRRSGKRIESGIDRGGGRGREKAALVERGRRLGRGWRFGRPRLLNSRCWLARWAPEVGQHRIDLLVRLRRRGRCGGRGSDARRWGHRPWCRLTRRNGAFARSRNALVPALRRVLGRVLGRLFVGNDPADGGENLLHRGLLTLRRLRHWPRPPSKAAEV